MKDKSFNKLIGVVEVPLCYCVDLDVTLTDMARHGGRFTAVVIVNLVSYSHSR